MKPSWLPWREIFSWKVKSPRWRPWNGLRPWFRAQRDRERRRVREDSSVIRCMNFLTMSGALEMRQRPTEAVQPPHHQRVARLQRLQHQPQLRTIGPRTTRDVGPYLPTPRSAQSVVLQRDVLPSGRDPRIAQKCAHKPGLSHNSPTRRFVTHQFRTRVMRHPSLACRSRL
jgi:uncharacterized protein YciI